MQSHDVALKVSHVVPTVGWLTFPDEEEEEEEEAVAAPELLEAVAPPLVDPPLVEFPDVLPDEEPDSGSSSRRLFTVQPTKEETMRPATIQRMTICA